MSKKKTQVNEVEQKVYHAKERLTQVAAALAPPIIEFVRGTQIGLVHASRPGRKGVTNLLARLLASEATLAVVRRLLVDAGCATAEEYDAQVAESQEALANDLATLINDGKAEVLSNFAFEPIADPATRGDNAPE